MKVLADFLLAASEVDRNKPMEYARAQTREAEARSMMFVTEHTYGQKTKKQKREWNTHYSTKFRTNKLGSCFQPRVCYVPSRGNTEHSACTQGVRTTRNVPHYGSCLVALHLHGFGQLPTTGELISEFGRPVHMPLDRHLQSSYL